MWIVTSGFNLESNSSAARCWISFVRLSHPEACGSAHYWGRELTKLGHDVRLISPQFVKPCVKSGKNDGVALS